jgi:hypothetical protein
LVQGGPGRTRWTSVAVELDQLLFLLFELLLDHLG